MELAVAKALANFTGSGEVTEDYSGRSMYGSTTAAITVDSVTDFIGCLISNAEELADEVKVLREDGVEIPQGFRTDSMGYDTIIY